MIQADGGAGTVYYQITAGLNLLGDTG